MTAISPEITVLPPYKKEDTGRELTGTRPNHASSDDPLIKLWLGGPSSPARCADRAMGSGSAVGQGSRSPFEQNEVLGRRRSRLPVLDRDRRRAAFLSSSRQRRVVPRGGPSRRADTWQTGTPLPVSAP